MKLVGADLVHGADHAAQHVVQAVVAAGALNRRDVARLAHHADPVAVAGHVLADGALIAGGVVEAAAAEVDLVFDHENGVGKTAGLLGIRLEEVIRDALSALGTDAGQAAQLIEENLKTAVCTHNAAPTDQSLRVGGLRG